MVEPNPRRVCLALLLLLLLLVAREATAQSAAGRGPLSLVERFGPDGMPFTHDDPLAPGGGAHGVRYAVMAADSCSENRPYAAHQHNASHPPEGEVHTENLTPATNHKARPTPADMLDPPGGDGSHADNTGANMVLEAPFDWVVFIMGMNLDDGQMTRHRAFPTDDHWTDPDTELSHDYRTWVTSAWDPEESKMVKVYQPGAPIKDLHIDGMGLSTRDVGERGGTSKDGGVGSGWVFAIHWETLDNFEIEIKRMFKEEYGGRLDIVSQQGFVQGWVAELVNLNSFENGISGNFVVDVGGVNPLGTMGFSEGKMGCNLVVRDLMVELGGVAGRFPADITFEDMVLDLPRWEYGDKNQIDYVIDMGNMEGFTCLLAQMFGIDVKEIARTIARTKTREAMQKLDAIIEFAFPSDDDYKNIGLYSGCAGREAKSPPDKLALALLEKGGQFEPTQWLKWVYLGANPLGNLGFDSSENGRNFQDLMEPVVTESTSKVMTQEKGWRYNFGSTYLAKSMMIYGGSEAERRSDLAQIVPVPDRVKTPDLLESHAKQWLHVRMDVIDPLKAPEDRRFALWKEYDALIYHASDEKPGVLVDWPPPNFNFGRAQVSSFRTGSGGQLDSADKHQNIDPETTVQYQGLVCVDPFTMTISLAGAGLGENGDGSIEFNPPTRQLPPGLDMALLSWTTPQPLSKLPGWLRNDGSLRWLSVAANHYRDANSVVKWMWDFDRDGRIDSEHAQQLADLKGSPRAAVFAYQSDSRRGNPGRTGFALIDLD